MAVFITGLRLATGVATPESYLQFGECPSAASSPDSQAILDHSQRTEKYSEADFLRNSSIPTLIDAQHAIAHNKIIIIDGYLVLTGSFNFTRAAEEHNAENLLVINDPVLAKQYIENWYAHEQHSEPFDRAPKPMERTGRAKRG